MVKNPYNNQQQKNNSTNPEWLIFLRSNLAISLIVGLSAIIWIIIINSGITGICPVNTWFKKKYSLEQKTLTIGIFSHPLFFKSLKTHLQCNLKGVDVFLIGNQDYDFQEGKKQLDEKKWDIGFLSSPMLAVSAKNNGYSYVTRTYPEQPRYYKAAIFVNKDSEINSIDDIKPETTIALGSPNSTATFYMPVYDLYGKEADIDINVSSIPNKVENGIYEVGTAVFNTVKNSAKFKIIQVSRDIPGGGVYLSPNISDKDEKIIKNLLMKMPQFTKKWQIMVKVLSQAVQENLIIQNIKKLEQQ